jgi:hypothetical protein
MHPVLSPMTGHPKRLDIVFLLFEMGPPPPIYLPHDEKIVNSLFSMTHFGNTHNKQPINK